MARNYAQVRVSIWQDDDFRSLPVEAQHLYFLLLTSPTLNLAGVGDWRPERIASLAGDWTPDDVRAAACTLSDRSYILTDESTEEVLVRTLVKHDGILRNPKTSAGMVSAWTGTYSKRLRAAIACEVQKLSDEVSESVGRAIVPLLDYQSDWVWDDPSARVSDDPSARVSVRVALPPQPQPQPATNIQQPLTTDVVSERRAPGKPKRASALPPGWQPDEAIATAIRAELPDIDLAAEHRKFCDHFTANGKPMKDWNAAWRNWMRRATQFAPTTRRTRQQETDDLFAAAARRMGVTIEGEIA